jgi:hypothetical protein
VLELERLQNYHHCSLEQARVVGLLGQALHGLGLVQGPLELALERPERALHGLALELLGQAVLELGQVLGLQVPGLVQVVHVQALLPLILGYNLVQLPVFPIC